MQTMPKTPSTPAMRSWAGAVVIAGILTAGGIEQGGFWLHVSEPVAAGAVAVLVAQVAWRRVDRASGAVACTLCALAGWWLIRAIAIGDTASFFPFGASLLGFAAAFVSTRSLPTAYRQAAATSLVILGTAEAIAGFSGLTLRWFPMAISDQGLWRLASTLTYSNAAGLALAITLLIALGLDERRWHIRVCVCVCTAGLLATQSRGAALAFACGALVVPAARFGVMWLPLILGAVAGGVAIGQSPGASDRPWVAVSVATAAIAATLVRARPITRVSRRLLTWGGAFVVAGFGISLGLLHTEISLRLASPAAMYDRNPEWASAWHQFTLSPWIGVGPDRVIPFGGDSGLFAHFAHNEYLQVADDAGAVGAGLLLLALITVARNVRRVSVTTSCAAAALVAFAVDGAFDYNWHIPILAMVGGWVAGMAGQADRVMPGDPNLGLGEAALRDGHR